MEVEPEAGLRQRRSVRLAEYDYGQVGAYYVTICTHNRSCLFGDVMNGTMVLNEIGQVVNEEWAYIELLRPRITLDEYVIMPNHLHAIVLITNKVPPHDARAAHVPISGEQHQAQAVGRMRHDCENVWLTRPSSQTIGSIIRGFKAATTSRLRTATHMPDLKVWQRNYYEHVVRDDADLYRIRDYINDNPLRWTEDEDNPARAVLRGVTSVR